VLSRSAEALAAAGLRLPEPAAAALRAHRSQCVRTRRALLYGDFVPANLIVTSSGHIVGIDPVLQEAGHPRMTPLAFWRSSCRTPSSYPALHFRRYAALAGNCRRRS
jgi:hypothetical protein